MLTIFLSAACSLIWLISAACRGLFSVGVRINSCIDTESFALTATAKMSHHFSHSVLGGVAGLSQEAGSPAKADGPLGDDVPPLESIMSRLAITTGVEEEILEQDITVF